MTVSAPFPIMTSYFSWRRRGRSRSKRVTICMRRSSWMWTRFSFLARRSFKRSTEVASLRWFLHLPFLNYIGLSSFKFKLFKINFYSLSFAFISSKVQFEFSAIYLSIFYNSFFHLFYSNFFVHSCHPSNDLIFAISSGCVNYISIFEYNVLYST